MFSLDEFENVNKAPENSSGALSERFYAEHCEKVDSIRNLCKLPSDKDIIFLWTLNSFNAFTFIPFIIEHSGPIEELSITTYSINKRIVEALSKQMRLHNILRLNLFLSDSIRFRIPLVYDLLESLSVSNQNLKTYYGWNHSKIALAQSNGNHFVIEGSGNFSENAQFEQYIFLNNERIYRFRKEAIFNSFQ